MRREQFAGVGSEQSFSQTNSNEAKITSALDKDNLQAKRLQTLRLARIKKPKIIRYALHIAVIAAVIAVVGVGKMNASQSLLTNGVGSTKDQTSLIATGAMLANNTQSLISTDINQRAQDLTNMSSLATAGDDFLAKKSPVLSVGAQNRDVTSYKVKDGDTLSSLSAKFNITTDTIKWANGITDENQIKPGAELTILPVNGILYTAQEGDDLVALAQKYQSNANLIENFNQLEGKAPTAGMKLVIPDGVMPAPSVAAAPTATVATTGGSPSGSVFRPSSGGNSYSYGYCTWYVANKRYIPGGLGNANQWPYNARAAGMTVSSTPVAGAAGVLRYGNHVVYIESVSGGTVYYTEMNGPAGWNRVNSGSAPASNFIYIY